MPPTSVSDAVRGFLDALLSRSSAQLEQVEQGFLIFSSVVSFLGCAFVFTTWKSFYLPNYLSRRIVASMGLAGLLTAFGFALSIVVNGLGKSYVEHEAMCYVQAFVLQYFYLASYLWTACFAFHLYQIIVVRNEYPERLLNRYRLVGWGVPGGILAYLVLRQLTGHLGVGGADRRWCWISVHASDDASQAWRRDGALQQLLLFYLPIACVFVFNAVMYFVVLKFLRGDPMAHRLRRRVALYLIVFFLCSVWGLVNRLLQFFRADHRPSDAVTLLESIFDPLQPLLNAVVYGTNKSSLDAYRERFCTSWFYSSLPSTDDEESGLDNSSLLSNDGDNEDDDRAFYYQDMRRPAGRKLTYPGPGDDDDDEEEEDHRPRSPIHHR